MFKQDLCQVPWRVAPVGDLAEVPAAARGSIPAQVPGCIHLDLIRAGIIKHPREGFAELDQFWVGKTDWRYECRFEADACVFEHECIDLGCEGLDTIATLELNGEVIGAAANMFHPHRFRLANLKRGENHLVITFKSPLQHIRGEEKRLGARPVNGDWDPYIFIRKAAVNFGWDFAPKVPTCGIWKPVRIEAWSGVRIAGARPRTRRIDERRWSLSLSVDLEWARAGERRADLFIQLEDQYNLVTIAETHSVSDVLTSDVVCRETVDDPDLWHPNGIGTPSLYRLTVLATYRLGTPQLDQWDGHIGFREVRLKTEPDEHGSKFQIEVNGKPIFCKGANWVPDALFPTEVTPERYLERVKQAADANMNMLRVWGGGYYEDEEFYRACDALGILVWQDFMFACAMYPEEPPYPALIEAEARHQITRLSSHPSVALWCGGNECVWAYESWGNAPGETPWKVRLGDKTWGRLYYFDLLPRLVAELDPTRPYWANSPWSGSESVPTNGLSCGDRHTWGLAPWQLRESLPRFCSEFGQQAPAQWTTIERVIESDQMYPNSPAFDHRQRATGGTLQHINSFIGGYIDLKEWHAKAQAWQQRVIDTRVRRIRAERPRCMGILIWQLNDIWPGLSWSLIDADGQGKPALATVRHGFSSRTLTIHHANNDLCVFGINDEQTPWEGQLELASRGQGGSLHAQQTGIRFVVPAASAARIHTIDPSFSVGPAMSEFTQAASEVVEARAGDAIARWCYGDAMWIARR